MKLSFFLILIISSFSVFSQKNFEFTDTFFVLNSQHEIDLRFSIDSDWSGNILAEESKPQLDSLSNFLYLNKNIHIEIGVHTDSRGSDTANVRLTQMRADFIKTYLINKGINSSRIVALGFGESNPIHSVDEINHFKTIDKQKFDRFHQENRRTIIRITDLD